MNLISAVIITHNEEKNIERCLRSIEGVVDEIIVVDSNSTDRTVEICRESGAQVYQTEWKGYAENKNYGNQQATSDYILSIDADEALSEKLRSSILGHKNSLQGAYRFKRLTNYCGQWIYHCGWYPDTKTRLFPKQKAVWEGEYVHEHLKLDPGLSVTDIPADLLHYAFLSFSEHIETVKLYSSLAAKQIFKEGRIFSFYFKLLVGPPVKFIKCYLLKRGFLDGFYGFCICWISAFDIFLRYARVIQMKRNQGQRLQP
jgi:glycosyltransferase involved in cell wall biosynthesis